MSDTENLAAIEVGDRYFEFILMAALGHESVTPETIDSVAVLHAVWVNLTHHLAEIGWTAEELTANVTTILAAIAPSNDP